MKPMGLITPENDIAKIHQTAVQILAQTGIRLAHPEMRDRLAGRGCRIAGEKVYFPPELIARTLEDIPSSFEIFGRSIDRHITVGFDETHGVNTGIFPNIYDFETGEIRRSTLEDVRTTTRLLDALDNVHAIYVSLVDATELPAHMVTVSDFAAVLNHTTKPLVGPGLTNKAEAECIVAMARALRNGNADELRRYPACIPFVCPVSPLFFPCEMVDALMVIAEAGLPLDALPNPVMGLTSPFTIAGTVALGHAEVLACAVMAHAVRPGLPILNQNTPSVADMRSLASTTGGPETGLVRQTVMLLSRYLQIPGCAHGHTSSARNDYQSGEEKALNSLLLAAARPSLLGGLGALANVMVTSYETIVLDNERLGAIYRILQGVEVNDDTLAGGLVDELADARSFLESDHTLKHLQGSEVWRPSLSQRMGLVNGKAAKETSLDRARSMASKMLASHQVPPLPESLQAEIAEILTNYDRSQAGSAT